MFWFLEKLLVTGSIYKSILIKMGQVQAPDMDMTCTTQMSLTKLYSLEEEMILLEIQANAYSTISGCSALILISGLKLHLMVTSLKEGIISDLHYAEPN